MFIVTEYAALKIDKENRRKLFNMPFIAIILKANTCFIIETHLM